MKCPECGWKMAMRLKPEVRPDGIYDVYVCMNPKCKHVEKKRMK